MNKQKIFIVEDSPVISKILIKVIKQLDKIEPLDFQSGEEMLRALDKDKPGLIFLDYYLDTQKKGYMNGEQVFDHLKEHHPEIPVVMITGMTDEERLSELSEIGFDDIIHKDHDQLFERIIQCVEKHSMQESE